MQRLEELARDYSLVSQKINNLQLELDQLITQRDALLHQHQIEVKNREEIENYQAYEDFKNGDLEKYETYIEVLKNNGNYQIKRGRKWDIFYSENIERFKVEKNTGLIYHSGKQAKGNIFTGNVC